MDSLKILVVISASLPAIGYLSAFSNQLVIYIRSRFSRKRDTAVIGPKIALSGADLAASNCLLALAVLQFALSQPEADLASAVPIWLLILHPLPLLWYWAEANVRRYMKKRDVTVTGLGQSNDCDSGQRRQFADARKLLRVSLTAGSSRRNSFEDVQLHTVERITVL